MTENAVPQAAQLKDDAVSILSRHGLAVSDYLAGLRDRWPDAPKALLDAMDYSIKAGGKRLRPALVLECAEIAAGDGSGFRVQDSVGQDPDSAHEAAGPHARLPNSQVAHNRECFQPPTSLSPQPPRILNRPPSPSALAAAAAIELIHTFSLVHDDLPAMDNDDMRRGLPTNHKVFGEAMAILAGDAMVTAAFELLATEADPRYVPGLVRELARATGPEGMIGGQVLDMDGESQALSLEALQRVHRMKTGALLTCSCRLGVVAGGAEHSLVLENLSNYGRHLGLAFQIVDDVLDVTSTSEQLGKATNKDADRGKNMYPRLLGLESSREEADKQLAYALDCLATLGPAAMGLRTLARFVVERTV